MAWFVWEVYTNQELYTITESYTTNPEENDMLYLSTIPVQRVTPFEKTN